MRKEGRTSRSVTSSIQQAVELPARWQHRDSWTIPGKVVFAGRAGGTVNPEDPTHAALLAQLIDVQVLPFCDEQGKVTPEVADADVVISGGRPLGEREAKQLP
ncbi:MAG TPA: hypothetical protein VH951_06010, partial [Dehalococcoidia bacterium]